MRQCSKYPLVLDGVLLAAVKIHAVYAVRARMTHLARNA